MFKAIFFLYSPVCMVNTLPHVGQVMEVRHRMFGISLTPKSTKILWGYYSPLVPKIPLRHRATRQTAIHQTITVDTTACWNLAVRKGENLSTRSTGYFGSGSIVWHFKPPVYTGEAGGGIWISELRHMQTRDITRLETLLLHRMEIVGYDNRGRNVQVIWNRETPQSRITAIH